MTQAANWRAKKRNPAAAPRSVNPARSAPRSRTSSNQPARRKRQMTKQMRRYSAVFAALPASVKGWQQGWHMPTLPRLGITRWCASKLLSLLLVASVGSALYWMHTDDRWFIYREDVQFNGLHYLDAEELYRVSDVENWNIFWLQPQTVREQLLALPYVAGATVQTGLFTGVTATIQEEQPVALWVTDAGTLWLLGDGTALTAPAKNQDDVLQIIDNAQAAKALSGQDQLAIDPNVLKSALALKQQLPEVDQLRFNKDYGLNFYLPGSDAWVYWGDGYKMETKFTNLAAIQTLIQTGEEQPDIIDIRYDRPYIR